MAKKLNHNLVKMHRSYTVSDVCELFDLHKNTVLNWVKNGLQPIDSCKPAMIQGLTLKSFLKNRNTDSKQRCKPNEMFCMRCKAPTEPANRKVILTRQKSQTGQLKGTCPHCNGGLFKFCSIKNLDSLSDIFEVIFISDD